MKYDYDMDLRVMLVSRNSRRSADEDIRGWHHWKVTSCFPEHLIFVNMGWLDIFME